MEPTSKRAENRREAKALRRDLQYIKKHTEFNLLMQSDDLNNVTDEEKTQLREKKHPNPILQDRFNRAMYLLKEVLTKQARLLELTRKPVENVADIQK